MVKVIQGFSGLLVVTLLAAGCESKFAESSPDSVKIKGIPLEERISQKAKVDSRIDEIQKGAEKAKKIVELFKKVQSPNSHEDVYTPIDFLLDANSELKSKMPENGDGRLVRRGQITLPIEGLSEQCRLVETLLESSVIYDESGPEKVAIGDRLTYSLKTCGSEGKFLSTIVADWNGPTLEFRLNNKNLETVFNNILLSDVLKNSVCRIKQGDKKIVESIYCENFEVRLTKSEYALVKNMAFNNKGDVRFETLADIYENQKKKAYSQIKVFSNGEVQFDVKKIDESANLTQQQ